MKTLNFLLSGAALLLILVLSLLFVMLNTDAVSIDLFGFVMVQQSLGISLICAFVVGILFSLFLIFIPSQIQIWRNKRLRKKLEN